MRVILSLLAILLLPLQAHAINPLIYLMQGPSDTYITDSFETGFDGWTGSASVTRTTDDAIDGIYSVRIPGGSGQYITKSFTTGAAGTVSFWHDFTGNGTFTYDIDYPGGSATDTISGSGSWTQVILGPYAAGSTALTLTYDGGAGYDIEVDVIRYQKP